MCQRYALYRLDVDNIEDDVDKVLTIRQELGKASLPSDEAREEFQSDVSLGLVELLGNLLPTELIKITEAESIVKIATEIRNALTVEHACYRFQFVFAGDKYDQDDWIECRTESEEGLKLCSFPALVRLVRKEDGEGIMPIIVERAKLDCE